MLSVEMNTRLWMLFTSLLAVASAGSVTGQSSSPPSSPASKSWFREKYLVGAYDTYYEYTLHRFELRDNDRVLRCMSNETPTYMRIIRHPKHLIYDLYISR